MSERIIHIEWEGPFSLKQISDLKGNADKGLYQIYACHPVYGPAQLVYIGQTSSTFSARIPN
jgi:hypothetical protein